MAPAMEKDHPFRILVELLKHAIKLPEHILRSEHLEGLQTNVSPLDIKTGVSSDGGTLFRVPYDAEQFAKIFKGSVYVPKLMNEGLDASRKENMIEVDLPTDEDFEWWDENYSPAIGMIHLVKYALGDAIMPEELAHRCEYKERIPDTRHFLERRLYSTHAGCHTDTWKAPVMLDTGNRKDPLACFLCERTDLDDKQLLRSEVICAAVLVARRCSRVGRDCVPSFVYTFSGHKARVINAYFDHASNRLVIRKTTTVSFKGGSILQSFELMMRWVMNVAPDHEFATC